MATFIKFIYIERVGEMEENAKQKQDGDDKTLSISILKLNKLHVPISPGSPTWRSNQLS